MASSSPEFIPSADSAEAQPRFSYKDASHEEVLEDLSSRFILNLPDEELASLERICFQVEQAHWFYEDFIREQNPAFPSLPLKKFSAMLFHACPLLHQWSNDHENAFNLFMQYKTRVPVCGAIMLNHTWDKCVLVKGWKSSSGWGFPKGKINEDEPKHICAIREVLEETGYNLAGKLKPEDVIELSIKEQRISLFVVPGVEEDFPFQTKTRKEISRIEWFRLADLPTWKRNKQVPGKFYLISPFIGPLKVFINEHKPRPPRKSGRQKRSQKQSSQAGAYGSDTLATDADTDLVQESDSQISDNQAGKDETRPRSHPPALLATDDILKTETIDPHFARLLSSLTLSASGNTLNLVNEVHSIPTDPSTPVSSTLNRSLDPEPLPESHQVSLKSRSHKSNASSSSDLQRDSSYTPVAASHQPQHLSPRHGKNHTREVLHSPPHTHKNDTSAAPTSPNTHRPRTDISPYLTKATVDTTSARRLQQLALLERVADESARMLPQPRHAAPAQWPPVSATHPGSPTAVTLPASVHPTLSLGVYYSSAPQPLASPHQNLPSYNSPSQMDFQTRAKTSQASHRGPTQTPGSLSMNQSQLLALMNNTQPVHSHPRSFQQPPSFPPPPPPPSHHPRPHTQFYSSTPSFSSSGATDLPPHPVAGSIAPNFSTHGFAFSGPDRFASATPAVDSFPMRTVPPSTAQTLLSILNGNRPLQGNPVTAPTSFNQPI